MSRFTDDDSPQVKALTARVAALEAAGYITGITAAMINAALGFAAGTNATGTKTISTSAASGGSNGDVWYQV